MNGERVSPTRSHAHDWKLLYSAPTEANSIGVRADWVMLLRSYDVQSSFICACGASGARSRGSSGCIVVVADDAALEAHAALWNLRLCADIETRTSSALSETRTSSALSETRTSSALSEEALLLAVEANGAAISAEELTEWFEEVA